MSDLNIKKSFINAVLVLFVSVAALGISLFLYIYWFVTVKQGIIGLSEKFNLHNEYIFGPETWSVILILSLLVALIIFGLFVIYIYFQKMFLLYRLQRNFFRGFTHELKTPVTSISLYIDTFSKHELDRSSQLKYLEYMQKDVKRLYSQIQRILNLARLETKIDKLSFDRVNLGDFIKETYNSYRNIKMNLDLKVEEKDINIDIDKGLFQMLLTNIFNNAIKYNDNKPNLKVSFKLKKKKLFVFFSDNGKGLKKRESKKIFRQFYQVDKNEKKQGTGLGLYLSQMIAKRHKGVLSAKSEGLNKGTTIILALKLRN
ncbi:MAG: HAMP domain-containing sensor histidine kinase [Desulforegulaceae bacterium]|nr:HAMP domain-containing sensor histidine kinase [Desulforegulaceae bacterium]